MPKPATQQKTDAPLHGGVSPFIPDPIPNTTPPTQSNLSSEGIALINNDQHGNDHKNQDNIEKGPGTGTPRRLNPFGRNYKRKLPRPTSIGRNHKPAQFIQISTGRKLAIIALHQSGASMREIAAIEKIDEGTASRIVNQFDPRELDPKIVESTKNALSSRLFFLADKSVTKSLEEDRLDKLSSLQLTTVAGIAIDKARLLDGMSTQNVSVRGTISEASQALSGISELRKKVMESLG